MNYFNSIAVLISVVGIIWVMVDSSENKIPTSGKNYTVETGAGTWLIFCIMAWFLSGLVSFSLVNDSIAFLTSCCMFWIVLILYYGKCRKKVLKKNPPEPRPMVGAVVDTQTELPVHNFDPLFVSSVPLLEAKLEEIAPPAVSMDGPILKWFYSRNNEQFGPADEQSVTLMISRGELMGSDKIWREGFEKWILVNNSTFSIHLPVKGPPALDKVDIPTPDRASTVSGEKAAPLSGGAIFAAVQEFVCKITGLETLKAFKFKFLFSDLWRPRGGDEVECYFNCGCSLTTPMVKDISSEWPRPWAYFKVFLFGLLALFGFWLGFGFFHNIKMFPGLIVVGAFAVPLSCVVLFFELNVLRNISVAQVLKLMLIGGTVSIMISLGLYAFTHLEDSFLGASSAGIIEEVGKLLTAVIIMGRMKRLKWTLNGILIGAAIGGGFAGFESAGYIFQAGFNDIGDAFSVLIQRAIFAPFCHVVWTAITVGALWRVKRDKPFEFAMLQDWRFLRVFLFVMALHMLWNSGLLESETQNFGFQRGLAFLWVMTTVGSWYVVLSLVQVGLSEVQRNQSNLENE